MARRSASLNALGKELPEYDSWWKCVADIQNIDNAIRYVKAIESVSTKKQIESLKIAKIEIQREKLRFREELEAKHGVTVS